MSLHFCQQTVNEAVLYSRIRKDAGGDSRIDEKSLSEVANELLAVDLPSFKFPRTPYEVFSRDGEEEEEEDTSIWREWRELSSEKHSALRDNFARYSRRALDKLKHTFSMVQGDRFIAPLLVLCTSQIGNRRPVPGIWKDIEGLELIHYIAVESQEDILTLRKAIVKQLDRAKAAAAKAREVEDVMVREMARQSSLHAMRMQRDVLALATLSSPPSAFFEKFNSVDIDRERRSIFDPVWAKLRAQPELCADFRLSKEELSAAQGWPAFESEEWFDTYWRCFNEWQATPQTRGDASLTSRLVRMTTDEEALRRFSAALPIYRDAEALLERSLLALLPQLDRLSPAQAKWLVYHAFRTRSINTTSDGSPTPSDRDERLQELRSQFRDPASFPVELTEGVLSALLDLLGEADCVSRGCGAGDTPRTLAARRLARAVHESPHHRAKITAGFSRSLRTVAGRDIEAEGSCDYFDRVDVAGLIDFVCDMQARSPPRLLATHFYRD
jgi:hypothetical protein